MSKQYQPVLCPECKGHIILYETNGEVNGEIRIKCRRCRNFFIVKDGKIEKEN